MFAEALYTAGTGALFGAALTASGVYLPSVIIDQFRLTDFHMFHVFAVGMGSSAATMVALEQLGIINRPVRSNTSLGRFSAYDGNILGGVMVGVGMALSGACPGTIPVQLAQGISSAKATALGALVGGGTYARISHIIKNTPQQQNPEAVPSKRTISDVSQIPEPLVYILIGAAITGVLSLTNAKAGSAAVSPVTGGLLIGLAQTASLLLTGGPLGVSAVYERLSQYILGAFKYKRIRKPTWPHKSIIFALGIVAGSTALMRQGSLADLAREMCRYHLCKHSSEAS
ncbi:hypothetical protein LTR08_003215 [Meristemomyces frigidus]|nr:hypothetical protein LTR08_003215 [Meristemomyces frigidus]